MMMMMMMMMMKVRTRYLRVLHHNRKLFFRRWDQKVFESLHNIRWKKEVSLSPRHGASSGCGWRNGLQLRIYWISSRGQPTRGGPPACGLCEVLRTPHRKILKPRNRTDPSVQLKQWNRDMKRPRRKLEDNIKMDLIEVGWGGMDWIYLA